MSNNEVVKNINVEDMEPGVVYQVNNPDIEKLKKRVISQKRKIKKLTIYNRILILGIIAVLLFMSITLHHMNKEVEEVINSYNEIIEEYNNVDTPDNTHYGQNANFVSYNLLAADTTDKTQIPSLEKDTKNVSETATTATIPNELDKYKDVPLDNQLKQYIIDKCEKAGIPEEILFAMAWKESGFDPNAKSSTNDHGLLQINECNFSTLSSALNIDNIYKDIYNPYTNVDCAIYILQTNLNNYHNDNWHHVLMRYNMGPGGANKCFNQGIYSSKYSRAIIEYAQNNYGFIDISL